MNNSTYDVVVIGAGNGGLAAAATALQKGLKTLLIERHNLPGGFASSFVRGRFEFEPSLHELCDVGKEDGIGGLGGVGNLFKSLGLDIELVTVPDAYRMIITNKGEELDVTMPFGLSAYINKMEEYVPGSKESVIKFFDICQEVLDGFNYIGASKGNYDKSVLLEKYPNFLKTAPYSLKQVQKALNIPQPAINILDAYWCFLGVETSRLSFTIYAAMFIKYLLIGAYIPKNRSHEISSAFEKKIYELGGNIMYNTKVDKILTNDSQVIGVKTDNGEIINTKHVISNASKNIVYSSMLEPKGAAGNRANKEVNARNIGGKGYVAYFGLNKTLEELGLTDYSYFLYPTIDTKKLYKSMSSRENTPIEAVVCMNIANPDCSPKGTSMITITTLYTDDAWDNVNSKNYVAAKNDIAKKLIDYLEKSLDVEIADAIEEFEVASPQTFARYTGAYDGAIYGYEVEPWDSVMPRLMMISDDIYIKGLKFCGGFAFRCHGYSSSYLSGNTAALLTYKEISEEK